MESLARYGRLMKAKLKIAEDAAGKAAAARLAKAAWCTVGPRGGGEVPKTRGSILGVPMIRIIVFWGLYWGPLI